MKEKLNGNIITIVLLSLLLVTLFFSVVWPFVEKRMSNRYYNDFKNAMVAEIVNEVSENGKLVLDINGKKMILVPLKHN